MFDKATINLENGKQYTIVAENLSAKNIYIEYAYLNGKAIEHTYITHNDIMNGGTLEFKMTDNPAVWGSRKGEEPKTSINEHLIIPAAFIAKDDVAFKGETEVVLENVDKDTQILYKLGDNECKVYNNPITISEPTALEIFAKNTDEVKIETMSASKLGEARYIKIIAKKLGKLPERHLVHARRYALTIQWHPVSK